MVQEILGLASHWLYLGMVATFLPMTIVTGSGHHGWLQSWAESLGQASTMLSYIRDATRLSMCQARSSKELLGKVEDQDGCCSSNSIQDAATRYADKEYYAQAHWRMLITCRFNHSLTAQPLRCAGRLRLPCRNPTTHQSLSCLVVPEMSLSTDPMAFSRSRPSSSFPHLSPDYLTPDSPPWKLQDLS